MVKITLDVEGMACGMCEAHVNDAIRKAFAVKKVSSSFHKKRTEILAESAISEEDLRRVVDATGSEKRLDFIRKTSIIRIKNLNKERSMR